jgi:hypothetical protein
VDDQTQAAARENRISPNHIRSHVRRRALITGITGQDGAYLAEFLIGKGYEVHGIKRRTSLFNTDRIDHLYQDPHQPDRRLILHYGDMTDSLSLLRVIQRVQPHEIYNLAAQSHVAVSFEEPEFTANADALGALRLLEAIRILGMEKETRFYQASTHTGSRSIIERRTASSRATASCSTTNRRCAARRSFRGRSRARSHASRPDCSSGSTSGTSMRAATGDTRATTSRCSG